MSVSRLTGRHRLTQENQKTIRHPVSGANPMLTDRKTVQPFQLFAPCVEDYTRSTSVKPKFKKPTIVKLVLKSAPTVVEQIHQHRQPSSTQFEAIPSSIMNSRRRQQKSIHAAS